MSKFKRRAFMAGHTDVFVMAQPYISGTSHINSDGQFDSVEALSGGPITQFELSFETESGAGDFQLDVATATAYERTLAGIVDALNTQFGAASGSPLILAEDFEGCLRLKTLQSGYDAVDGLAYVRILPNQTGATFEDGAELLGFPRHPHAQATATAGDLVHAPVRPLLQVNRPGVAFLARGEDRVSQNFNRALHQLAINEDSLNTRARAAVPVPTILDLGSASGRLIVDGATGNILGVNLTPGFGDDIDSVITSSSRVFVGGLSRNSSLSEIAEFFGVQDQDDNQIPADERVVRVGAVVAGNAGTLVPTFASEYSVPTAAIADSVAPLDGGNVLGLQREKTASTTIDLVEDGCILVCEAATFESDGVLPGDSVRISGSTINSPVNHNGTYIVERVISETRIEIRPEEHESVILLNESASGGLGSATVATSGNFIEDVVLLFSPPLSDFPPDRVAEDGSTTIPGMLRIVVGVESPLGEVPTSFLARSTIRTSAEVDAFVNRRLWRRMSFDGIYQGQSFDYRGTEQGGGAEGRITHGPITLSLASKQERPSSLTYEMTGSGSLEMRGNDLILVSDSTYVFSDTDIGKVIFVTDTGGTLFAEETPFVLSEFLSYRELRLTPPVDYKDWRVADLVGSTTCDFKVSSEGQAALQAAMLLIANDETAAGDESSKTGVVFVRNHRDGADADVSPGTSALHLDKIRHVTAFDGVSTYSDADARLLSVTTGAGARTATLTTALGLTVHPEHNQHLFWAEQNTERSSNGIGCTLLRIVNGPNAGFYEIHEHTTSVGTFTVYPLENALDGSSTWSGFVATAVTQVANLYNVVFAVGGKRTVDDPVAGTQTVLSGITAFADGVDKEDPASVTAVARAIQAHWVGSGSALHVRVNNPELYDVSNVRASTGSAIDIRVYNPAVGGSIRAHGAPANTSATSRLATALKLFTTSNVLDVDADAVGNPENVYSSGIGAGLVSGSQNLDPAGYFISGFAEDGEVGEANVSDSTQSAASTLVLLDARGHASDWKEVVSGLFIGSMSFSGSVFGSTNSSFVSMSPIASSVASLPVFGGSFPQGDQETGYGTLDQPVYLDRAHSLDAVSYREVLVDGWSVFLAAGRSPFASPASSETDGLLYLNRDLGARTISFGSAAQWDAFDQATFPMKHNFCISLPSGHGLFTDADWTTFPGRLAWLGFDTTGGATQNISYLYRIEAIAFVGGRYKMALRADPDPDAYYARDAATDHPAAGAALLDSGVKAARWTRSYIDLAESMVIGTGIWDLLGDSSRYYRHSHLPALSVTRGSDVGLYSGLSESYENGFTGSWSTRFPSAPADSLILRTGALRSRKISLNEIGSLSYGSFRDINGSTVELLSATAINSYSGSLASKVSLWADADRALSDGYDFGQNGPFSNEFSLGKVANQLVYVAPLASVDTYGSSQSNIYFSSAAFDHDASRWMLDGDLHFSSEDLDPTLVGTMNAAGVGTDPFEFLVKWTPSRDGALAVKADDAGNANSIGLVRVWIPLGRNIVKESFSIKLEAVLSGITSTALTAIPPYSATSYLQVDVRDPEGNSFYTGAVALGSGETRGTVSGSHEYLWTVSQELLSDKNQSAVSGEDGGLSGFAGTNKFEREIPLFVTIDIPLGSSGAHSAANSAGVLGDAHYEINTTAGDTYDSYILFDDGVSTSTDALLIHALQVTEIGADAFISKGLEVAGVLSAKEVRLRDVVRRHTTYGPGQCHFIVGNAYAGVYSSMAHSIYGETTGGSALGFSVRSTDFGHVVPGGMGSATGRFQPWPTLGTDLPELSVTRSGSVTTVDRTTIFTDLTGYSGFTYLEGELRAEFAEQPPMPDGGTYSTKNPDALLPIPTSGPWLSPEIPFGHMTIGVNGAQIMGGSWSDPLWYQQAILAKLTPSVATTTSRLFRILEGKITSISDSQLPAYVVDPLRIVHPSPTGFMVPVTNLRRGDVISDISYHVSIRPHLWTQTQPKDFVKGAPGLFGLWDPFDTEGGTAPWWLNEYRQGEWGVYYDIPFSDDGLRLNVKTGTDTDKTPIVSTSPDEWNNLGGFAVEIWRSPIGVVPELFQKDNKNAVAEAGSNHGEPQMLHREIVSLVDVFTNKDSATPADLQDVSPATLATCTSPEWVTRYGSSAAGDYSRLMEDTSGGALGNIAEVTPDGELHIKGTVSLTDENTPDFALPNQEFRADPTQFAYYVVVKCFLSGARAYSSSAVLRGTGPTPDLSLIDMFVVEGHEPKASIGQLADKDFCAYTTGSDLRVVPNPHGSGITASTNSENSVQDHFLPTITLKGVRVGILTDKA